MHTVNSTVEDLNDAMEEFGSHNIVIRENGKIILTAKEHED